MPNHYISCTNKPPNVGHEKFSSIEDANAFAPEFIQDFNRRFAVQSRSIHNAHRPLLLSDAELDQLSKPTKPAANHPWRTYGHHLYGKTIKTPNSHYASS
jgi:hypothetical protein